MTADLRTLVPGMEGNRGPNPSSQGAPAGAYHKTFLTYQPWQGCVFCQKRAKEQVEEKTFEAPERGSKRCTHTDNEEYNMLLLNCLRGRANRTSIEVKTLVDGTVQVTVDWVEYDVPNEAAQPARPPRL